MVARPAERPQQGVLGGQPADEGETAAATLERGQALLERVAGRVAGAAVFVPHPGRAHRVLREGAGLVDRWNDRPGPRVGLLPGVDGEGVESVVVGAHGWQG